MADPVPAHQSDPGPEHPPTTLGSHEYWRTITPTDEVQHYLDTVDRLAEEFGAHRRSEIADTVSACRQDLATVPTSAVPEMVERLAHQRLTSATPRKAS
ncbi:hypothetical protein [Aeromicrobium sp. CTD01-1L150]|uniref:hypothetical protein n=1 Tax=Aeromicrobium sp. CTD01-1L150 TaxID=3341830 RepID=UPI0035BFF081